jgi:S1-C subfamily serine protease
MTTPSDANDASNAVDIPSVSDQLPEPQPPSVTVGSPLPPQPNEITSYEQEQSGIPPEQLKNLQEYDSGGELSTSLGMQLREDRRALKSGEEADGLLITGVRNGSPAADAGLHPYNATRHNMMTGVAMAGAMFFPPAILLVPALDYSGVGESYDLIIGVDGARVRNFLDYQDCTRNLKPGEMIYLSIVRNGKRVQLTLTIPPNLTQATN